MISRDPERPGDQEAIRELTALVAHAFRQEQREIWGPLLDAHPPGAVARLLILARLALSPDEPIPLLEDEGSAFCPDDRGLARFRRKFALSHDGVPFCVGLLLRDDRGRRKTGKASKSASGLLELPDPVILVGLQRALDSERREGQAEEDSKFGKRLLTELGEMGLKCLGDTITDEEVRTLRDRLNRLWKRLGERGRKLFPNKMERQRKYGQERSTGREDGR
jgi:hypothetical protein